VHIVTLSLGKLTIVGFQSLKQCLHDGVVRVNLEVLFGEHVFGRLFLVSQSLILIDFLHLGGVAILAGQDEEGRIHKLIRDGDLFDLLAEHLLVVVGEGLVHLFEFLVLFFLSLGVIEEVHIVFGDRLNFFLFVLGEMLNSELINRVRK